LPPVLSVSRAVTEFVGRTYLQGVGVCPKVGRRASAYPVRWPAYCSNRSRIVRRWLPRPCWAGSALEAEGVAALLVLFHNHHSSVQPDEAFWRQIG